MRIETMTLENQVFEFVFAVHIGVHISKANVVQIYDKSTYIITILIIRSAVPQRKGEHATLYP